MIWIHIQDNPRIASRQVRMHELPILPRHGNSCGEYPSCRGIRSSLCFTSITLLLSPPAPYVCGHSPFIVSALRKCLASSQCHSDRSHMQGTIDRKWERVNNDCVCHDTACFLMSGSLSTRCVVMCVDHYFIRRGKGSQCPGGMTKNVTG